jgi:hypothetical protein
MLRDRRPGDLELIRDLAGRKLAIAHERQDPPPPRLGDRLHRSVHAAQYKRSLTKVQTNACSQPAMHGKTSDAEAVVQLHS